MTAITLRDKENEIDLIISPYSYTANALKKLIAKSFNRETDEILSLIRSNGEVVTFLSLSQNPTIFKGTLNVIFSEAEENKGNSQSMINQKYKLFFDHMGREYLNTPNRDPELGPGRRIVFFSEKN
eukprot:TRINITY_DN4973_c0_g1_i2.p1 TRINITY_DN4973_c0_g1~~TRINITY_DN4973_c0_g1_i2.p1  ORF type:complete len:126 (+),score=28.88 TRINITY_DN4973_c0_g1_i2:30-407(+)